MDDVINFINSFKYSDKPVVLACSYGPDSMCLLDLLIKNNIDVVVAHVNHNLREESKKEYIDLENYCNNRDIIFEGYVIDSLPKGNVEKVSRDIRYKFFESVLKKYNSEYLFTAHHGDDLIETVLMRLNRGASFKGYAGFSKLTKKDDYYVVRPLVFIGKDDIDIYNKNNNIPFAIDKTNYELVHTRNIYRHIVLPSLKKVNPHPYKKYIKYSEEINDYYNYVNREVSSLVSSNFHNNRFDINNIINYGSFIIKLFIKEILFNIYGDDINLINDKHLNMILELINSNTANEYICLPKKYKCNKFYNIIEFSIEDVSNEDYNLILENEVVINNGLIKFVDDSNIIKSNYLIRLNSSEIKLPIHIRNRRIGDKISLNVGTKKVGKILSDSKVPVNLRDSYPIVTDDNDVILWIPGVKKSKFNKQIDAEYDILIKYIKKENYDE